MPAKMSKMNKNVKKEEPVIDYGAVLRAALAADPIMVALQNGTMSWADCVMMDEPEPTQEELEAFRAASQKYQAEAATRRAAAQEEERLLELKEQEEAEEERKYMIAGWASEEWWAKNRCTCTWEQIDSLPMGSDVPCLCYKRVHLTEDGEPEECRFFNSPAGCRDGAHCVYKHVERDPSTMPCRFEASAVGCNPGFGRKCPYMHTKPQVVAAEPALCRFDGRCHPAPGKTCPFKHSEAGWSRAGGGGGKPPRHGGGGAAGGWRK